MNKEQMVRIERLLEELKETVNGLEGAVEDLDVGIPVVGRLTPNGNSVCLIFPKTLLEAAGWHAGDTVYARVIRVDFRKTSVDAEKVPRK